MITIITLYIIGALLALGMLMASFVHEKELLNLGIIIVIMILSWFSCGFIIMVTLKEENKLIIKRFFNVLDRNR